MLSAKCDVPSGTEPERQEMGFVESLSLKSNHLQELVVM
jgi:hypothetical protein